MTEEVKILRSLVETGVLLELGIYKVGICFENCIVSYKEEVFIKSPKLSNLFLDL